MIFFSKKDICIHQMKAPNSAQVSSSTQLDELDLKEALEDKIAKAFTKKKMKIWILYLNISSRQCFANSGLFNTDNKLWT